MHLKENIDFRCLQANPYIHIIYVCVMYVKYVRVCLLSICAYVCANFCNVCRILISIYGVMCAYGRINAKATVLYNYYNAFNTNNT